MLEFEGIEATEGRGVLVLPVGRHAHPLDLQVVGEFGYSSPTQHAVLRRRRCHNQRHGRRAHRAQTGAWRHFRREEDATADRDGEMEQDRAAGRGRWYWRAPRRRGADGRAGGYGNRRRRDAPAPTAYLRG